MKKIITLAMVLCMSLALLSACGGSGGNTPSENPGDVEILLKSAQ